jgi:hypothetical protein
LKNAYPTKEFIAKNVVFLLKPLKKNLKKMRQDNKLGFKAKIGFNPKGNTYYYEKQIIQSIN